MGGGRMSRHRNRKPKGVQNSPLIETTIESLTLEGQGVAHVDGKTVFIDGALPGETVAFRYTSHKQKHDIGKVETILTPSPDRVEPRCEHFGVCGACSWQHISLEAQIRYKQRAMLDNLKHIGKVEPETVFAPLTADGWAYRRKARLGAKWVRKKDKALVGFREKEGGFLAELNRCEILHPSLGEHLLDFQALIASLDARESIPQIETAVGDGDNATALIFRHMEELSEGDTEKLLAFGKEFNYQIYLQPKGPETVHCIYPENPELYYEHPHFNTKVGFMPLDFIQVNQPLNRAMVARALELLAPEPTDTVLDLFCGLGNFTLPLARMAAQVIGVEGEQTMVERARAAAHANGIMNTDYHVCNLMGDKLQHEPWLKKNRYDKILLDPPRAGAKEIIAHFGKLNAGRIVYVSCDPATLARDTYELVHEHGYRLVGAGVMDMFPHTSHVESIAVFEK
jgi:23S rRNA (uracil1939-C5)-methyltransferase